MQNLLRIFQQKKKKKNTGIHFVSTVRFDQFLTNEALNNWAHIFSDLSVCHNFLRHLVCIIFQKHLFKSCI